MTTEAPPPQVQGPLSAAELAELDQADRYSFMEPLILADSGQQINNQSLVEMGQSYSIEGNLLKQFPQNNNIKFDLNESFFKNKENKDFS